MQEKKERHKKQKFTIQKSLARKLEELSESFEGKDISKYLIEAEMANEEDKQNLNIDFMRNYKSCGTTQDSFDQCFQLKKEKQKIQKKKAKKITFSKQNSIKDNQDKKMMHTHSPETPKRKILGSFYELSEESSEIGSSSKVLTKKSISIKSSRSIRTLKDLSQSNTQKQLDQEFLIDAIKQYIIGEGIHGKVYKAKSEKLGKGIVVKKFLKNHHFKNRQVSIISQLKGHPNIVEFYEAYSIEKQNGLSLQIVMQHYQSDLNKRIQMEGNFSLQLVRIYMYQILRGLNYMHKLNIVHRDINSNNILITDHSIALCDFGCAKYMQQKQQNVTYVGQRNNRAPELLFNDKYYTQKIDIWSVGCVMIQMILGRSFFEAQNSLDLFYQIIKCLGTSHLDNIEFLSKENRVKFGKWVQFPNSKKKSWNQLLMIKQLDSQLKDLLDQIFEIDPRRRISAIDALKHCYFDKLRQRRYNDKINEKYNIGEDFFSFLKDQIEENDEEKLIPEWYRNIQ